MAAESVLYWLDIVGCNPKNQTIFALMRWFLMTSYTTVLLGLIVMLTLATLNNGLTFQSIECLLNFFLMTQFVFKYCFFRYYPSTLSDMFDEVLKNFWKSDIFDEKKVKFDRMHSILYRIIVYYRNSYVVMNFMYTIEPLFYKEKLLRIPIWTPTPDLPTPFYQLWYLFEMPVMLSADFVMLHFELLSLFMMGTAYVQLDMIKTRLRMIGPEQDSEEIIKSCVEHHNLILNHLQKMVSVFSMTMLQQVVTYVMAICLPAYLFTSTRTVNVGFCICTVINIMNFFLYCLVGQFLHDQCISVSDAVYECDWWKSNDRKYKQLLLIMQRSTKGVVLTAGGFVDFTIDTFIKAMKASFSILQFLWSTNSLKLDK